MAFFFLLSLDSTTVKGFLLFFRSTFTAFDQNPFHSSDVFCLRPTVSRFWDKNSSLSSRWIRKISLKEATSMVLSPLLSTWHFFLLLPDPGIFRRWERTGTKESFPLQRGLLSWGLLKVDDDLGGGFTTVNGLHSEVTGKDASNRLVLVRQPLCHKRSDHCKSSGNASA